MSENKSSTEEEEEGEKLPTSHEFILEKEEEEDRTKDVALKLQKLEDVDRKIQRLEKESTSSNAKTDTNTIVGMSERAAKYALAENEDLTATASIASTNPTSTSTTATRTTAGGSRSSGPTSGAFSVGVPGAYPEGAATRTATAADTTRRLTQVDTAVPPTAMATAVPGGETLIEAREIPEAQELDPTDVERRKTRARKERNFWIRLIGGIVVVLVLVVVLTLVFTDGARSKSNETSAAGSANSIQTTSMPTASPTNAPTGGLDKLYSELPATTLERMNNQSTPQWQAWWWLQEHPTLLELEEYRKKQLFALVTFFYAMGGHNWPPAFRDNWLLYDLDECFWYSSEFGQFVDDGTYEQRNNYDKTPCNEFGEFQHLLLGGMQLGELSVQIPPEMAFLTALQVFGLPGNRINASLTDFLPPEIYNLPNLTVLNLWGNSLYGTLPTELGTFRSLLDLELQENLFHGTIPTEIGLLTELMEFSVDGNQLEGTLPTELSLTKLQDIYVAYNKLRGTIPTEFAQLTSMEELLLYGNQFSGTIMTEYGRMSNLRVFRLYENDFTGTFPSELGLLTRLTDFNLYQNNLSGEIPSELAGIGLSENLTLVALEENQELTGTIPDILCKLGFLRLAFDCSEQLCGCCWCPCRSGDEVCEPEENAFGDAWPGAFPNTTNAITINIHTDEFPEEILWEWSIHLAQNNSWQVLNSGSPPEKHSVFSYTAEVDSESLYRLQLTDIWGDGSCCAYGRGWMTILGSSPNNENTRNGTVIWKETGKSLAGSKYDVASGLSFQAVSLEVYLWIDDFGYALQVEWIPHRGYAVIEANTDSENPVFVVEVEEEPNR